MPIAVIVNGGKELAVGSWAEVAGYMTLSGLTFNRPGTFFGYDGTGSCYLAYQK